MLLQELFNIYFNDEKVENEDKEINFEIPLAGVDKKDTIIKTSGRYLKIKANKEDKKVYDNTFRVPVIYDLNKTNASMKNGLLKINIPLKDNEDSARTIKIE